jgi:hypothetical protein
MGTVIAIAPLDAPNVSAYTTPDLGYVWDFDDLVNNSSGAVEGPIGGPYIVHETISVLVNDTLVAKPGTQVFVDKDPNIMLHIQGNFYSNGTPMNPVLITSNASAPEASDWFGFYIDLGNASIKATRIEYTTFSFFVHDGNLQVDDSVMVHSHPNTVYFDGGSLRLVNVTIPGTPPPPSSGLTQGSFGVFAVGTVTGEFLIDSSTIFGGDAISGGSGGDAIILNRLIGPVQITGNTAVVGGKGGDNILDGANGGFGGYGVYVFPVPNLVAPPGIMINGNINIMGGRGGNNSASFDGSSGGGSSAIAIFDDDQQGRVTISENQMILGGDGGDNHANFGAGGFTTGGGGHGLYLDSIGVNETTIQNNFLVRGGRGGENTGSDGGLAACSAGEGGEGISIYSSGGEIVAFTEFIGGDGGDNFGTNCTGGDGGTGISVYDSQYFNFSTVNSTGGSGGANFAAVPAGGVGQPGSGGFGIYSHNASSWVVSSLIFGGKGGDNSADNGWGGRGGAGVYTREKNGTSIIGGVAVGGEGGDNVNINGLGGGRGWPALVVDRMDTLELSGVTYVGGKGGDTYLSTTAIGGRGSQAIWVFDSTSTDIHDSPFINAGGRGIDYQAGNNGMRAQSVIEIDEDSNDTRIRNNLINQSTAGIFVLSPSLIDGNVFENNTGIGILVISRGNWTNITNNRIASGFSYGVHCSYVHSVTLRDNTIEMGDGGVVVQAANVLIDHTWIGNMSDFGVHGELSGNFLMRNSTVYNATRRDIELTPGSNGTTLNTTFDGTKVGVSATSNLTVKNFLHLEVLDNTLAPLSGEDSLVTDNGAPVYSTSHYGGSNQTTDASGRVNWLVVTDRIYIGNNIATENITSAEVWDGVRSFINNPRNVDMSVSHEEVFVEAGPDAVAPRVENVLVDGLTTRNVFAGDFVALTATLNDMATGDSPISSGNYTLGYQNWALSSPVLPLNPPFDSSVEDVNATIDTSFWPLGPLEVWVHGCDIQGNCNTTGAFATINVVQDNQPPLISGALINGQPSQTYDVSTLPATVTLSAMIDDTITGGSSIDGANYTEGPGNWGTSKPMNAQDGNYNDVSEVVEAVVPTKPVAGFYMYCVYGWDWIPNYNLTGLCASLNIVDDMPPEIQDVKINGMDQVSVVVGVQVSLTAIVNDSITGSSVISLANYTLGIAFWPSSTPMSATDGDGFNEPVEAVGATVDTSSLTPATYRICVNSIDVPGNSNNTCSNFATLEILSQDNIPPEISDVRVDGQSSTSVTAGTVVRLSANVSDLATGGSNITSANYTFELVNWSSAAPMDAADGLFDSPFEEVEASVDTIGWAVASTRSVCVYASDEKGNNNVTSPLCAQITIMPDVLPPYVVSTFPGDFQTSVNVTVNITVSFNEPMNPGAVNQSFIVDAVDYVWTKDDGTITWSDNNRTMTFSPNTDMDYETTYIVIIRGDVAEDLSGNNLDGNKDGFGGDNYTFRFKTRSGTAPPSDVTPPTVTETHPDQNERVGNDRKTIEIVFSEPVDRAAVEVHIDPHVPFEKGWSGNKLVITILDDLYYGSDYSVEVSGVKDLAGNDLDVDGDGVGDPGGTYNLLFKTLPRVPGPMIVNWQWIVVLALIVVAVILAILLVTRRREKEPVVMEGYEEEEVPPPPEDEVPPEDYEDYAEAVESDYVREE